MSCKKEYSAYYGTHQNYIKMTFKGVEYLKEGEILFVANDKENLYGSLSRRCSSGYSNYNWGDDTAIIFYLTIPAYSDMINESLIGTKYYYEGGGCGSDFDGNRLFGFDLNFERGSYSQSYSTPYYNSSCYHQITEVNPVGTYYDNDDMMVYEVKGIINTLLVNHSTDDTAIVNNCTYSICIATHMTR